MYTEKNIEQNNKTDQSEEENQEIYFWPCCPALLTYCLLLLRSFGHPLMEDNATKSLFLIWIFRNSRIEQLFKHLSELDVAPKDGNPKAAAHSAFWLDNL